MIWLIISIISLVVSLGAMLSARHSYHKTRAIEERLKSRNERPRYNG